MTDAATDPEPADRRTNEWKAWNARQAPLGAPATSPVGSTRMAEATAFIAAYAASDFSQKNPSSMLSCAKRDWQGAREFLDWVRDGKDVEEYKAIRARQQAIDAAEEADRAAVVAAEAAAAERRKAAWNAKQTASV